MRTGVKVRTPLRPYFCSATMESGGGAGTPQAENTRRGAFAGIIPFVERKVAFRLLRSVRTVEDLCSSFGPRESRCQFADGRRMSSNLPQDTMQTGGTGVRREPVPRCELHEGLLSLCQVQAVGREGIESPHNPKIPGKALDKVIPFLCTNPSCRRRHHRIRSSRMRLPGTTSRC